MESRFVLIVVVVVLGIFVGLLVLAALVVAWARKALSSQQQTVSRVDESMELSREGIELSRRAIELLEKQNALTEEIIRNQREIVGALRRTDVRGTADSAIRT